MDGVLAGLFVLVYGVAVLAVCDWWRQRRRVARLQRTVRYWRQQAIQRVR
jgi:hypothetical protein